MNRFLSTTAKQIKNLRTQMGVSQNDLAKYLGISRQAVGQIETGERRVSSEEIVMLCEFFNVPSETLLFEGRTIVSERKKTPSTENHFKVNIKRFQNTLLHILKQCGGKPNLGETVLYKLLYFIDFDAFELLGRPLTGLHYVKLQYGPVPKRDEYEPVISSMTQNSLLKIFSHSYFGKVQKRYIALAEPNLDDLSSQELEIINHVISCYSDMSASEITQFVHGDIPWKATNNHEVILYNWANEREPPYARTNRQDLIQSASAFDLIQELGPMSDKEASYYAHLK